MTTILTVTDKGQVTFSKELLVALGISEGEKISLKVDGKNAILKPLGRGILDLVGKMPVVKLPKGKTVDDLIHQARYEHAKKTLR
jgi:bifunctional DNA-binding transcriptional regulator/antitoxin component of YhaV-PrlF toxin-antitoxin module